MKQQQNITYKDVCEQEDTVWFEIDPKKGKQFLKWAKNIGCVWANGEEIDPRKGTQFLHVAVHSNGKIANVAMFAWVAKQFEHVTKYYFPEYIKGNKISPKEYWQQANKTRK